MLIEECEIKGPWGSCSFHFVIANANRKSTIPAVPFYKTLSTNSHPLGKLINLVSDIKFVNNL